MYGMISMELELAIDEVAMAFGWKNTRKLWIETRGFTTSLETAIKDYPNSGLVPEEKLKGYIKQLKDFTDPDNDVLRWINLKIEEMASGGSFTDFEEGIGDLAYGYAESDDGEALNTRVTEQAWEKFKLSSDCEHIEALRSRSAGDD
jgi:hypothetical protein